MTVFACRSCAATLTVPVSRAVLPAHARQSWGYGLLGTLMEPGTYAVDPVPFGPPWPRWDGTPHAEEEALGWYAPTPGMSCGPRGAVVLAPGDVRGAVLDLTRAGEHACCGWGGGAGPNMRCEECGELVATRIDDCGRFPATWLDPRAVRAVAGDGPHPVLGWAALRDERPGIPPAEPRGGWSPVWQAAVAAAIAQVLVVSEGAPVAVPDGPVADAFRGTLDAVLPPGAGLSLVLAGPGLPADGGDIALVPLHPRTGASWPVPGGTRMAALAWDVWAHLAFAPLRQPVPDPMDDPGELVPWGRFEPDGRVLRAALARVPEVRQPWLRTAYDRVHAY